MKEFTDALARARQHFRVIGVFGQARAGVNTFMLKLFQRRMLLARGMNDDIGTALASTYNTDEWVRLHLQNKNVKVINNNDGTVTVDNDTLFAACAADFQWMQKVYIRMFDTLVDNQVRQLNLRCDQYPSFNRTMNIPFFIEIPINPELGNINDLVDELIVIRRPSIASPDPAECPWWLANGPTEYPAHSYDVLRGFFQVWDNFFESCNFTPTVLINNDSTVEAFEQRSSDYIDHVAGHTVLAIQNMQV